MASVPDSPTVGSEKPAPNDTMPASEQSSQPAAQPSRDKLADMTSPGVARIEAISSCITRTDRIFIFIGVFLVAYAYGLDGTTRYNYEAYATSSTSQHSLLSTVNVIRSVIAAAAQPTAAKIADVFGRVELICASVFFYVLGTVVQAVANDVKTFCGGSVLYQTGYTMIILLVEVVIADITSTRARLFFSFIPALPFLINAWISGNVVRAVMFPGGVLDEMRWKWGIGMWCIIYPVMALPLIVSLSVVARRAKKQGLLSGYKSSFAVLGWSDFAVQLFWVLDVVGLILLIAVFALILAPLTLAGGLSSNWKQGHIIAPLVVGIVCIPVFVLWELFGAPHPLVPFKLMKDRGVWAACGIALLLNFSWTMQGDYLWTVLQVAFDFDVITANRVSLLYSFVSVVIGTSLGFVVFRVRRLKVFIIVGTCLFMVAFGLLIHYRGGASSGSRAGVIGAQCLLGVAGGMFPYTAQASLQVGLKHENLAVMTGIYLATYNVGSALGNAVSGALWTQLLPQELERRLSSVNATLVPEAYGMPLSVITVYPIGTPERDAMVESYQYIQRLLTITGICLCVPLIMCSLSIRNPRLDGKQTLVKEEEGTHVEGETEQQKM